MATIIACSIAFLSIAAFLALWFWVVRKELKTKHNMVEVAKGQLAASRRQILKARDAPEAQKAQEIFERSLDICNQSVDIYNKTYNKVWNRIPGYLLGFNRMKKNNNQ